VWLCGLCAGVSVYHIVCGYVTTDHITTHYMIYHPFVFVFQVTQEDLGSFLMMAGYCRTVAYRGGGGGGFKAPPPPPPPTQPPPHPRYAGVYNSNANYHHKLMIINVHRFSCYMSTILITF
jgi:hypothetical protein